MNAAVIEFPKQRPVDRMEHVIRVQEISTAPRDGSTIMAIDLHAAASPRWREASWIAEEGQWFVGSKEDHEDAVMALEAGEICPEDYACCFHEAPTHWHAMLPVPKN